MLWKGGDVSGFRDWLIRAARQEPELSLRPVNPRPILACPPGKRRYEKQSRPYDQLSVG
jgi:hypothetical protein